jgi:2-polyprenyl-3-methyl-5-hydroxy-6-metoxy-1,4-benzoquinol methylase
MTDSDKTREPQYKLLLDIRKERGVSRLGLMINEAWQQDPKRMLFVLARYKFVAKMLSGKHRVLEVGCADAFGTRIVQQEVQHVTATDFDPIFINDAIERMDRHWQFDVATHDIIKDGPVKGEFDAAYSLDVIEHISPSDEPGFISNIAASLTNDGVFIVGTPSLESQQYASPQSREGHVNCKHGKELEQLMRRYFCNVFMFSMNDELVHTGFFPMAHYLFAVCCGKRAMPK